MEELPEHLRTPVSGARAPPRDDIGIGEDRERQVVDPELGKPESLGEGAYADLLEPRRREAKADRAPGARQRRDRNEQAGEADRGNERNARRAEHRGHLRANEGRHQEAKPGRRAHTEEAAGDERRPGALDRHAEHEERQQDERAEAREADQRRREAAFRAGIPTRVTGVERKLAIEPLSTSRTTPSAVMMAGMRISITMMTLGTME